MMAAVDETVAVVCLTRLAYLYQARGRDVCGKRTEGLLTFSVLT